LIVETRCYENLVDHASAQDQAGVFQQDDERAGMALVYDFEFHAGRQTHLSKAVLHLAPATDLGQLDLLTLPSHLHWLFDNSNMAAAKASSVAGEERCKRRKEWV